MLAQLALFFILLTLLFFLAEKISTQFYGLLFLLTQNKEFCLAALSAVILPGTAIHELAHFLTASILRVPTGQLSIFPTVEEEGQVKTGKLTLGKTDPFRLAVIGLAPMFIGLTVIYTTGKVFFPNIQIILDTNNWIPNILGLYLLFTTSVTMFSSNKDLESLWIAAPIIFIMFASLYMIGVKIFLEATLISRINAWITDLNYYLLLTTAINYIVLLFLILNLILWQKILRRNIYYPES